MSEIEALVRRLVAPPPNPSKAKPATKRKASTGHAGKGKRTRPTSHNALVLAAAGVEVEEGPPVGSSGSAPQPEESSLLPAVQVSVFVVLRVASMHAVCVSCAMLLV